jgi:CDP-6-deoxy-D-xylo-4-hexulose-3-dehydrase
LSNRSSKFVKRRKIALSKVQKIIKETLRREEIEFIPGKTRIPLMMPFISWQEINEALDSIMKTEFTMGRKVKKFEENYAAYIGTNDAIMANSGSSANLLALSTLTNPRKKDPIKSGDEIVCPAIGWATTFFPMVNTGLIPVYVDIDLGTYNINIDKAEEALSDKTSAIMPVHLGGNPCEMDRICEIADKHDLYLVEDTCEAHGSDYKGKKTGSFGDIGTFSFYISHHMTTIEGGMFVTSNDEIAEIAKSLRAFGWIRDMKSKKEIATQYSELDERFLFYNLGYNLRPTEIAASFGLQQLKKINANIKARRVNAKYWLSQLKQFEDLLILPETTKGANHVWQVFPITVKPDAPFSKTEIVNYLEEKGVETRPLQSGNMVDHPSAKLYKYRVHCDLPNAKLATKNGFMFGNFPQMTREMRQYITKTISDFISLKAKR